MALLIIVAAEPLVVSSPTTLLFSLSSHMATVAMDATRELAQNRRPPQQYFCAGFPTPSDA
jgi:hypothetical protein